VTKHKESKMTLTLVSKLYHLIIVTILRSDAKWSSFLAKLTVDKDFKL